MAATAALSAAAVADLATDGRRRRRVHGHAGARRPASSPSLAGLLRLGFLANFISEPVLKGFIIGLALTDHHRPGPEAPRRREGRGRLLRAALGRPRQPRRHPGPHAGGRCSPRWRSCSACAGSRPAVPGSLVAVLFGIVARGAVRPRRPRRRDRRSHRQRAARRSGRPTVSASTTTSRRSRSAVGIMLVGFAEGLGAAKTYAAREPLRDRPQPRAARPRRRQPRRRALQRHGGERQPLQDRRQRLGRARTRSCRASSWRRMTVVTLLFLTGLFEDLPEATLAAVVIAAVIELVDIAALRRPLPPLHAAARPHLRARGPARLHRRDRRHVRRAASSTRCRACSSASPSRCCSCSTARRGRTSPSSGRVPGTAGPVRRPSTATRRTPSTPGRRDRAGRGRPVLRQRRRRPRRAPGRRGPAGHQGVVLDAESIPFVDVTAVRMLDELADDLGAATSSWRSPTTSARSATCSARPAVMTARWRCTPPSGPRSTPWPSRDRDAAQRCRVRAVLEWIRHYDRRWLVKDLLGGLAAGAVVIPQAMAYATIADLPVQVGLYTCMVPMVVYALLGGSRTLSVSTTSTIAVAHRLDADRRAASPPARRSRRRPRHAHPARRRHPARGPAAAPRRADRQHLRGHAHRHQGRRRPHGRRRPAPEAARHPRRPVGRQLLRRDAGGRRAPRRHQRDDGGLLGRDHRRAARPRPARAAVPAPLVAVAAASRWWPFASIDEHGVALIAPVPVGPPHAGRARPSTTSQPLLPGAFAIAIMVFLETASVARAACAGPRSRPSTTTRSWLAIGARLRRRRASSGRCRRPAASPRPPSTSAPGPARSSASWSTVALAVACALVPGRRPERPAPGDARAAWSWSPSSA